MHNQVDIGNTYGNTTECPETIRAPEFIKESHNYILLPCFVEVFFQATWNDGNFARTVQRLFSDFSSKIVVICPSTVNSSTNLRTDPTTREVELELPKWREGKYLVGLPQLMVCGCWVFLWFFVGCTRFLKLTAKKSTWKRGPFFPKKGKDRIPTIPFLGVRTCYFQAGYLPCHDLSRWKFIKLDWHLAVIFV